MELIPLEQVGAPALVIDIVRQAQADRDYRLTRADVLEFESRHRRIEPGTIYTEMPAGAGPDSVSLRASVSIAETVSAESQARAASASSLRVRRYDARRA
jgi:hypothetical protein